MLKNIRVILVRTYHPGNIGSAARAMKTMGLKDLVLVNPVDFPSEEAVKMSAGAENIINNATLCKTVYEATKDCVLVIASTARSRGFDLPELTPEESADYLVSSATKNKVALMFGPERMGLSNDDLEYAKYRVTIPANPEYSSLNLASAVQILCYEVFKKVNNPELFGNIEKQREFPLVEQVEQYYSLLEDVLKESGFIMKKHPGKIMQKLRVIFSRAQLDKTELNILHGIFASFYKKFK